MRVVATVVAICGLVLAAAGCGSDSDTAGEREAKQAAARQARIVAAERRERRQARQARAAARERRHVARRKARRQAARQQAREEARKQAEAEERERIESEEVEDEASECDPSYSGACLDPYASDYDCEGGSGDGPEYTGPVAVVGDDHYGLDSDSDGYGCE